MIIAAQSPNGATFRDELEGAIWDRDGVSLPSGEIQFRCPLPGHDDLHPSARFNPTKAAWFCDVCGQGGGGFDLAERLGLEPPELSLAGYAEAKQLPVAFLERLGLSSYRYHGRRALRIPYRDRDGSERAVRYRIRMTGKHRFQWKKGATVGLYGLDQIDAARSAGYVVLAEGESDAQTLWLHGEPALGIPGAANFNEKRDAPLLDDIAVIFVVVEPDQGGTTVCERFAHSRIRDRVRLIDLSPYGVKDVSALHCLDPERFEERWAAAKAAAVAFVADVTDVTFPIGDEGRLLLDAVEAFLGRFVAYPSDHARIAHTLWIAHAHAMDAWDSTPRIAFLSPEPASGKTRALEVSELLVPRPIEAINVSAAYLFRKVDDALGAPTILFDEVDTVFGPKAREHEDVRGLLNAGHRKGAVAGRCIVRGTSVETVEYPAYCAVALAGLGDLPDTILTRSVVVRMRRRAPHEAVEPFRRRKARVQCLDLSQSLEKLGRVLRARDADVWPDMPDGVEDRDADVWEALLAVADVVGGDWPERARRAAIALVAESKESSPSLGIRLLADLRTVFGDHESMSTADILAALDALPESPWSELVAGKPINARGLSKHLAPYGVKPKVLRIGDTTARGYARTDLIDAWTRYLLSPTPPPDDPNGTTREVSSSPIENVTSVKSVTSVTPDTSITPEPRLAVAGDERSGELRTSAFGSDIVRITCNDDLATVLPALLTADVLGLDVETTGLDARRDSLQLVQLATRDRVYLIDPATVDLAPLTPLLTTAPSTTIVGHNLAFDLGFLHAAGLPIPSGERLFDTMLASQVMDGGAHPPGAKAANPSGGKKIGFHSLAAVAHRWLGETLDKSQQVSDWSGPQNDEQIAYAAKDAGILLPLHDALTTALADEGLTPVAALEHAALPAIVWLESTGAPIDVDAWTSITEQATATLRELDTELASALPAVNVDSPFQLTAALAALGISVPNVQETTLRAVADQHPVIGLVLRRKAHKKLVSTYGAGYLDHVSPATGRLYPSYRLIGAASGRMSCSRPNVQNVPRDGGYRRSIRPLDGRIFVRADYSQIELRIATSIANDAAMKAAFIAGDDLHTKTARAVLGRDPSKADRQLAKALNFGLAFGMGALRLRDYARDGYGVTLSEAEAIRFKDRFFQAYPGLRAWHRAQQAGDVTTYTLTGRPRHGVSRFTEKLNSPVQGTGADILKGALARLWMDRESVPSAAPVLVVHDEIVCEVDHSEAQACAAWLTTHMTAAGAAVLTNVPVVVETDIVADWSGTPWELTRDDAGTRGHL